MVSVSAGAEGFEPSDARTKTSLLAACRRPSKKSNFRIYIREWNGVNGKCILIELLAILTIRALLKIRFLCEGGGDVIRQFQLPLPLLRRMQVLRLPGG
jgi:hypothetical protein